MVDEQVRAVGNRENGGRTRSAFFWTITLSLPFLFIALLYLAFTVAQGSYAYYQFKIRKHGWAGAVWRADPELGYAHAPDVRSEHFLAPGVSVPVRIDQNGFRVPQGGGDPAAPGRPLVLSLGDSIAFGYGCLAEEAYAFIVGRELGGSTLNAAVSGYSLAQMTILARDLIPRFEPDYVLVLYGQWMARRSKAGFTETRLAAVSTPYFVASPGGGLETRAAPYRAIAFDFGLNRHWSEPVGFRDYASFVLAGAVPLLIHRDLTGARFWLDKATGRLPQPVTDDLAMVRAAFGELAELSARHGAALVVVGFRETDAIPPDLRAIEKIPGVVVAYPKERLFAPLPERTREAYVKAYLHWAGSPPVLVDMHPNPRAHRIIGEVIVEAILQREAAEAEAGDEGS